jgi:hypothetical protein
MKEDNFYNNHLKKFIRLDLTKINFESFLGLGFESILVAVVAGVIFGFLIGAYPFFVSLLPILPSTNLILFIGFGVPLTGTTHYEPRLGILSSAVMLIVARYAQLLLGLASHKSSSSDTSLERSSQLARALDISSEDYLR